MRKDHALLQWLTLGQALESLQEMTKLPTTAQDLVRLCEEGHCGAYVRINPSAGRCDEAQQDDAGEWTFEVFGAGYQHVANPTLLLDQRKSKAVSVHMTGPVRTELNADSPEIENIAWEASIEPDDQSLYFKTSEISLLAAQINGADDLDPRERKSINQLIETLAEMAGLDLVHPAADMITIQTATQLSGHKALNKDTIIKYLKLAKGSRPLAPP
ncbi:hypothetical protein ACYZTR_21165 [Pseudomonas sp. Hz4]